MSLKVCHVSGVLEHDSKPPHCGSRPWKPQDAKGFTLPTRSYETWGSLPHSASHTSVVTGAGQTRRSSWESLLLPGLSPNGPLPLEWCAYKQASQSPPPPSILFVSRPLSCLQVSNKILICGLKALPHSSYPCPRIPSFIVKNTAVRKPHNTHIPYTIYYML